MEQAWLEGIWNVLGFAFELDSHFSLPVIMTVSQGKRGILIDFESVMLLE